MMMSFGVVHNWRDANPDLCGGPDDPVEQTMAEVKEVSGWDEDHPITLIYPLVMLLFRRGP